MNKPYRFLHPQTNAEPMGKTETVTLFGNANDPQIIASKKRIELLGRSVEIQPLPDHDTGMGLCGQHYCNCTEICKSMKYENI